jgi:hypothetical protein
MSEELKGERAEFDEWASAEGINTCRSTHSDSYAFPAARASWKAWQARAAQPPAAEGAVIQAAKVVMREALDSVCVHPCDEHNDDVRANCLSENMQALYHVLRTAPSSSASERTADEAGGASNDFEKALWELVDEARKWEKAYLDGARIYESLHHEKTDVEQTIRMIVNRFAPKQAEDAGEDEAVGIADEMPGTRGGFTMATFRASDVPAGSSLYTRPASAQPPALSRHGLSSSWKLTKDDRDWIEVTCYLRHVGGHEESVSMGGPPDTGGAKNAIQARASTKTYLERYTMKAITGLSEQDDDNDGAGAGRGDDVQTMVDKWTTLAKQAKTEKEVREVWAKATPELRASKDTAAFGEVKSIVEGKIADFKAAEAK